MNPPTFTQYRDQLTRMGHLFFTGAFNPNLAGIRSPIRRAGNWDDMLILAYEDDYGRGHLHAYPATTDPSDIWLKSDKSHKDGTAIVMPDQHIGCWQIGGLHNGKYPAFRQVAPMRFVRDANKDDILDIEALIAAGKIQSGIRGFNGHRASMLGPVPSVGLYSAGCQVWRLTVDFDHALGFCLWTVPTWGSRVSYTLLDEWRA